MDSNMQHRNSIRDWWQNNSVNNEQQDWNGHFISPPRWAAAASQEHITSTRVWRGQWRLSDNTATTQPTCISTKQRQGTRVWRGQWRLSDNSATTQPTCISTKQRQGTRVWRGQWWLSDNTATTQPTCISTKQRQGNQSTWMSKKNYWNIHTCVTISSTEICKCHKWFRSVTVAFDWQVMTAYRCSTVIAGPGRTVIELSAAEVSQT